MLLALIFFSKPTYEYVFLKKTQIEKAVNHRKIRCCTQNAICPAQMFYFSHPFFNFPPFLFIFLTPRLDLFFWFINSPHCFIFVLSIFTPVFFRKWPLASTCGVPYYSVSIFFRCKIERLFQLIFVHLLLIYLGRIFWLSSLTFSRSIPLAKG